MSYRHLTYAEISALEAQACSAEEWSRVMVAERFSTNNVHNVRFSGDVRLGVFDR